MTPDDLAKLEPVIAFVRRHMEEHDRESSRKDIDAAVEKVVARNELEGLSKDVVRDLMVAHAVNDPDFDKAFRNRAEDPGGWGAALDGAAATLIQRVGKTTARAEHGGNKGPSVADRIAMSDAQWRRYLEDRSASTS